MGELKEIKSHFSLLERPIERKNKVFFRPSNFGHMILMLKPHFVSNWKILKRKTREKKEYNSRHFAAYSLLQSIEGLNFGDI